MEKHQHHVLFLIFFTLVSLNLASVVFCILGEIKKTKVKDMKVDGKLCYLPKSPAYSYVLVAITCIVLSHIIGNLLILCNNKFSSKEINKSNSKVKKNLVASLLLVLSWISFGLVLILLSAATSMSKRQPYGKGWLHHECYLVKDGVYGGSAVLALVNLAATIGSAILKIRHPQLSNREVHDRVQSKP